MSQCQRVQIDPLHCDLYSKPSVRHDPSFRLSFLLSTVTTYKTCIYLHNRRNATLSKEAEIPENKCKHIQHFCLRKANNTFNMQMQKRVWDAFGLHFSVHYFVYFFLYIFSVFYSALSSVCGFSVYCPVSIRSIANTQIYQKL